MYELLVSDGTMETVLKDYDYNASMSDGLQENSAPSFNSSHPKKRKLNTNMDIPGEINTVNRRSFLPIHGGKDVFATEEWRKSTSALFLPVTNDVYLNLMKYEQITASHGTFFTGDASGNFSQTLMGHVIHLWRYDKTDRKLYVALSYMFANSRDFMTVESYLQNL